MSNTNTKTTFFEKLFFWVILLGILAGVNYLIFSGMFSDDKVPKVDNIGDTVVLRYAPRESYYIDGIDGAEFTRNGKVYTFYSDNYTVRSDGAPYDIMNSKGEKVGTVSLRRDDGELSVYKIDLAETGGTQYFEIPASYDKVRVYTTGDNRIYTASIQIAEREHPIEVEFDNVNIEAPEVSPVLYSLSAAHVNIKVVGRVSLVGGRNPYTMEHVQSKDQFIDTLSTAASAYCVCMVSAVGTAASIVYGVDYYMDMFAGVTALQLNVMDNAWGKFENLVNGQDGYPGLDGVPAVQVAGKLNIVGDSSASLTLQGGNGGEGGKGTNSFMTTTKGGKGGSGASAIVCGTLATNIGDKITYLSGLGGNGGEGGSSVTGTGSPGNRGGQHEPKVVIDSELLYD